MIKRTSGHFKDERADVLTVEERQILSNSSREESVNAPSSSSLTGNKSKSFALPGRMRPARTNKNTKMAVQQLKTEKSVANKQKKN